MPFGAGGGTDTYARIIKKAFDDNHLLPQPLVIVNRGGAGATIGSRFVKDSPPDGYTVLILHDAILTAKASGNVDYGPEAFAPVAGTGEVGMVVCVRDDARWKDLSSLMDDAAAKPDTVRFGANLGALTHYAGMMLENERPGAQFRFAQIGGGAQRLADLLGGHIEVTGFSFEEYIRFQPQGVRGLAYLSAKRHPVAPDLPTAREQGFDIINTNTFYWWFPKGTPPERVQVFADALEKALATDYVEKKMAEIRYEPLFLTGPALHQRIVSSAKQYENVTPRKITGLPNLPAIVSCGTLGMLGIVLLQTFLTGGGVLPRRPVESSPIERRPRLALGAVALTIAYVALLNLGWTAYGWATFVYLLVLIGLLDGWRPRRIPLAAGIAALVAVGLYLLFTLVFNAPLP
ncbi:MAG: tripartite tricarboxylate transporter substrate-binding protein [Pirellulaceae bacterium]